MSRRKMRTRRRGTRAPPYGAGALSTRRGRRPDVPSARQRRAGRRIPTPVCTPRALASRRALARNDSASRCRDVGNAVPYEGGRTDPRTGVRRGTWAPPYGERRSRGADRVARRRQKRGFRACGRGGRQGRSGHAGRTGNNNTVKKGREKGI